MGLGQTKHAWVVVLLIITWMINSNGAVKPRDPKPAPTSSNTQKPTTPAPQSKVLPQQHVATDSKAESAKIVAQTRPAQLVLENPATFTPDMTFGRAIDILRHCAYPPVNIVVLWRDVEERAGITRDTPIGLDGLPGLRIRQYIDLLLRSVSAGADAELSFCLDGDVILVATKDSLPKPRIETRVYDISDLVAPPSTGIPMFPVMPSLGGVGSMSPYSRYGVSTPYGQYTQQNGYNSRTTSSQRSSRTQARTPGPMMLYGR